MLFQSSKAAFISLLVSTLIWYSFNKIFFDLTLKQTNTLFDVNVAN